MLAERERIEGIQQIEVAWSRVPGAESTGLHTEHTPSRGPSLTLFHPLPLSRALFSFPLWPSPFLAVSAVCAPLSILAPSILARCLSSLCLSSFHILPRRDSRFRHLRPRPPPAFSLAFHSVRFLGATPSGVGPLAAATGVAYRRRRRRRRRHRRRRRRRRRRCSTAPSREGLASSLSPSTSRFILPFLPRFRRTPVDDNHPPLLADVSASRIASVSHPMANATSESRRG